MEAGVEAGAGGGILVAAGGLPCAASGHPESRDFFEVDLFAPAALRLRPGAWAREETMHGCRSMNAKTGGTCGAPLPRLRQGPGLPTPLQH